MVQTGNRCGVDPRGSSFSQTVEVAKKQPTTADLGLISDPRR